MAFKGVLEINSEGEDQFLFDYCNSETNMNKFFKTKQNVNHNYTERISQHSLHKDNLFFNLTWYNTHDLDIYVKCPCEDSGPIYHGNRQCKSCLAFLEIDSNA